MSQQTNVSHLPGVPDVDSHSDPHADLHSESHAEEKAHGIENRKTAMWLFLGSEVMFFSVLIAGFLYARILHPEGHSVLNIPITSLNTFLLLTSSFTVVRSLAAIEEGNQLKFTRSIALTGLLGTIFLGIQFFEYMNLVHEGLALNGTTQASIFGMAFFSLTGFHGFHVLIGVLWTGRIFWNALNGKYTKDDHFDVEFYGLYWHFVDVVWIFIFTIVYLM